MKQKLLDESNKIIYTVLRGSHTNISSYLISTLKEKVSKKL